VIAAVLTPFDESARVDGQALSASAGWLLEDGGSGPLGAVLGVGVAA
jgi:hypothetical protein